METVAPAERPAFLRACRSPALWAFTLVAKEIGFDAAVSASLERDLPLEVAEMLSSVGYTADHLPPGSDVLALIRVFHAVRKSTTPNPADKRVASTYGFQPRPSGT